MPSKKAKADAKKAERAAAAAAEAEREARRLGPMPCTIPGYRTPYTRRDI